MQFRAEQKSYEIKAWKQKCYDGKIWKFVESFFALMTSTLKLLWNRITAGSISAKEFISPKEIIVSHSKEISDFVPWKAAPQKVCHISIKILAKTRTLDKFTAIKQLDDLTSVRSDYLEQSYKRNKQIKWSSIFPLPCLCHRRVNLHLIWLCSVESKERKRRCIKTSIKIRFKHP